MYRNTPRSYGAVARAFHWATALVILGNIGLGLLAHRLPMDQLALKFTLFSLHKTLGVAAFALGAARILWALSQPRPVPLHPERRAETTLAEAVHWVLYASLMLVPLTGWIEHAATEGYAPILWPLGQGLPMVPKSPELALTMAALHKTLAWVLMGAVALHVAGALKHALIDRDHVLSRMLTGRAAGRVAPGGGHALPALVAVAVLGAGAGWALNVPQPQAPVASLEAQASEWQVLDGDLAFSVRQMGAPVRGGFSDWTASISFDPDSGTGVVSVSINLQSATLGTVTDQLRGPDFLDAEATPVAIFDAAIRPEGEGYIAEGSLSLRGDSMPVTLPFDLQIADGIARMQGATVLDRRDWGMGAAYPDDATVGFDVALEVSLTATRDPDAVVR